MGLTVQARNWSGVNAQSWVSESTKKTYGAFCRYIDLFYPQNDLAKNWVLTSLYALSATVSGDRAKQELPTHENEWGYELHWQVFVKTTSGISFLQPMMVQRLRRRDAAALLYAHDKKELPLRDLILALLMLDCAKGLSTSFFAAILYQFQDEIEILSETTMRALGQRWKRLIWEGLEMRDGGLLLFQHYPKDPASVEGLKFWRSKDQFYEIKDPLELTEEILSTLPDDLRQEAVARARDDNSLAEDPWTASRF